MNGYAEKAEVTTETSGSPSDDQLQSLLKAPYIPTRGFMLLLCSVPQLWPHGLYPSGTSVHGIFLGRSTGVDCLSTSMGSPWCAPAFLHCKKILYRWAIVGPGLPWWLSWQSACNVGKQGSLPGWDRSSRKGNGNPLQYSRLENSMDRGALWATVHGVTKSRTQLSD